MQACLEVEIGKFEYLLLFRTRKCVLEIFLSFVSDFTTLFGSICRSKFHCRLTGFCQRAVSGKFKSQLKLQISCCSKNIVYAIVNVFPFN